MKEGARFPWVKCAAAFFLAFWFTLVIVDKALYGPPKAAGDAIIYMAVFVFIAFALATGIFKLYGIARGILVSKKPPAP